jgi:hypothetical protein
MMQGCLNVSLIFGAATQRNMQGAMHVIKLPTLGKKGFGVDQNAKGAAAARW